MLTTLPVPNQSKLLDQFQKRYQAAQEVAYLWMALHNACYFYAIPNRDKFWRPKEQQGEMRGARVYDTTAIEATKTFVSKMHSAMTPPQTQWGYMALDPQWAEQNPDDAKAAQQMLDEYMMRLFGYIHDSNFDVVINEAYFNLAVGTACLLVNQYTDKNPLMFTSIPMEKLAVEEAMTGKLESWYRWWEDVKINEIKVRWPKARIPDDMLEAALQTGEATIRMLYEGVMYMPKESPKAPYCYIVANDSQILYHEFLETNPGIIWRFQKTNDDIFGRGPVMDALPSIISLNELARIELAAANLNTFKPYMAFSDAVFNPHTFVMQPMTIIPIAPLGNNGPPLVPLPDSSSPQFSQLTINDLRQQINRLLFADSPIPNGPGDSKQPASATELMINNQMLAQRIGPLFSRLQQEFLVPLLDRCSYILDKMGLLPKPDIKGLKVNFQYRSPLALAKGQEQIARFTQFVQLLQGISGPEMAQIYINSGEYPYMLADLMQLDPRFLNDPDQVKATAQGMQDRMQQMQDQQMQQQQNEAQEQALPAPQ